MPHSHKRKHSTGPRAYIFTIPKAGTYLMDTFLTELGMQPTGWHISLNNYLDTLGHDAEVNKATPSATTVQRHYLATFKRIPEGGHAFGHFNPLFVPPAMLNGMKLHIIAVRRHPREAMVSEFIDFRHRRNDVEFVSVERYPDHREAFLAYMRDHAPVIRNICANYLLLRDSSRNIFYRQLISHDAMLFLDFRQFIDDNRGPEMARRIADFLKLNLPAEEVHTRWRAALDADNKTRSNDVKLPYHRDELWTPAAQRRYEELGFPDIETHLGY